MASRPQAEGTKQPAVPWEAMGHLTVCQCLMRFNENGTKMHTVYTIVYHILFIYKCNYSNYAITNGPATDWSLPLGNPNKLGWRPQGQLHWRSHRAWPCHNSSNQEIWRSLTCLSEDGGFGCGCYVLCTVYLLVCSVLRLRRTVSLMDFCFD